ncbi:MAG: 50S ribosomal protein L6 [Weeksellaceae bacterium]
MSKIGQKPVEIPAGVQITMQDYTVVVKGPKGELKVELPRGIQVNQQDQQLLVTRKSDTKELKSLHGLIRSLIANAAKGVADGWTKRLEIVGTGFNVKMQGQDLIFKIGYSHPVVYTKVEGVTLATEGNTKIVVSGFDKQLVGQVAQQIKSIKKPDPYKGKGIRDEGQQIKLKPGKKAKA